MFITDKKDLTRSKMRQIAKLQPMSRDFVKGKVIKVDDLFQKGYSYKLRENYGQNVITEGFEPHLSPKEMLSMGVFEGKYLNDCVSEFPRDWFLDKNEDLIETLSPERPDIDVNYFKIKSRQSLGEWIDKEWIPVTYHSSARTVLRRLDLDPRDVEDPDPRGWFLWLSKLTFIYFQNYLNFNYLCE